MIDGAREVRLGIVGLGNIGRQHLAGLTSGKVNRARIVATCSPRQPDFDAILPGRELPDTRHFLDLESLLEARVCDGLIIATPTFEHERMGTAAVAAGLHVLMEKPLARSSYEAQRWIERVQRLESGLKIAVMLNQRVQPDYAAIKQLLTSAAIGEIHRVSWIMTHWYRPDVYFRVSPWRGTWIGEGGGALLNQCIHNLDILQWLVGMPRTVTAQCQFGRYHDIEVEDEAAALLRFDDGRGAATGTIVASTGESPGTNELTIVGDAGTIRYDDTRIELTECDPPVSEHSATTLEMFGSPEHHTRQIEPADAVDQHAVLVQNFVDAILDDEPLIAPASDGLASLDLANAILMSAWLGESVSLPLDREAYQGLLDDRITLSSFRTPANLNAEIDMQKSYR